MHKMDKSTISIIVNNCPYPLTEGMPHDNYSRGHVETIHISELKNYKIGLFGQYQKIIDSVTTETAYD
jgi:hypothetical protein